MGDWYVIAAIPTFLEKETYNGVETYELNDDGTIATTFTFNKGALDGPRKTYTPKGFVSEESTGVWGMRFIWPIKAEYRIIYLTPDYGQTVIGRSKRDYVWIMARESSIPESDLEQIKTFLIEQGYDLADLRMVPHG
jgi:apolipoprotein D and lipocalin family protein